MAISGQGGIQGGLGSQSGSGAAGALEAFLRLRNHSREKFALPETTAKAPANALAQAPTLKVPAPKAPVQESVSAFAEAKAGLLKMAGQYQRNGAAEKVQQGPKLGQIVDFRA